MKSNKNLLENVCTYLEAKDLSSLEQVSKLMNNICKTPNFNCYWREECVKLFSNKTKENSYFANKNKLHKLCKQTSDFDWKSFTRIGLDIKNTTIKSISKHNYFFEVVEFNHFKQELYALFKGILFINLLDFSLLPKLRKVNPILENNLNSNLHVYNFENIYDTQDLFDHYNKFLKVNNTANFQKFKHQFAKNQQLPFSYLLLHFDELILNINSNENLKIKFFELRWFKNNNIFQTTKKGDIHEENPLVFIIDSLYDMVQYFCQLSLASILGYQSQNIDSQDNEIKLSIMMEEYNRRYNDFVSVSCYLNDYLENLNVLINYAYQHLYPNCSLGENGINYSVFRYMMTTWNQIVLKPLVNQHDLIKKSAVILESILIEECSCLENNKVISDNSSLSAKSQLIASFVSSLIDMSSTEFQVFYINSTEMRVTNEYLEFESIYINMVKTFCIKFTNCGDIINFINKSEFINKHFINRTKKRLLNVIFINILNSIEDILLLNFFNYMITFKCNRDNDNQPEFYLMKSKEVEFAKKMQGEYNSIIVEFITQKLYNQATNVLNHPNNNFIKYLCITFFEKLVNNNILSYEFQCFVLISDYITKYMMTYEGIDEKVAKETKRKNVILTDKRIQSGTYELNEVVFQQLPNLLLNTEFTNNKLNVTKFSSLDSYLTMDYEGFDVEEFAFLQHNELSG